MAVAILIAASIAGIVATGVAESNTNQSSQSNQSLSSKKIDTEGLKKKNSSNPYKRVPELRSSYLFSDNKVLTVTEKEPNGTCRGQLSQSSNDIPVDWVGKWENSVFIGQLEDTALETASVAFNLYVGPTNSLMFKLDKDDTPSSLMSLNLPEIGKNLPLEKEVVSTVNTNGTNILSTNVLSMSFVSIKPGTFMMGSPKNETGRRPGELQHEVNIPYHFWVMTVPVTQEIWTAHTGEATDPKQAKFPVVDKTYAEMELFCFKVNEYALERGCIPAGYVVRSLTEEEFEYACRAGTTTAYNRGFDDSKFLSETAVFGTTNLVPVMTKKPNAYGIYDAIGLVNVMTCTLYHEYGFDSRSISDDKKYMVIRGGSFKAPSEDLRSGARNFISQSQRFDDVGIRICIAPKLNQ